MRAVDIVVAIVPRVQCPPLAESRCRHGETGETDAGSYIIADYGLLGDPAFAEVEVQRIKSYLPDAEPISRPFPCHTRTGFFALHS